MKSVHFVKASGKLMPEAYLQKVCSEYNAAFGLAVVHEGHIATARQKDVDVTPKSVTDLVEKFTKETIFVNLQDATTFEDDVGPFSVLEDADGNSLLVVSLDGDFPADDASTHTPASHAAETIKRRVRK